MRKSKSLLLIFAFAAATSLSIPVLAQGSMEGGYLGGSIGQSKAKQGCDDLPPGFSCDDKDTAWKIFGGYQFNQNFAVEIGYSDLGETKASGVLSGVNINATAKANAWDLVAVGSWPIASQFSVYGKMGAYYGSVDAKATGSVPGFTATATASDNNTGLTFGFGARYDINRSLGVRAEWQRYDNMGGDNTGKSDVDVLSIGVIWRFQ